MLFSNLIYLVIIRLFIFYLCILSINTSALAQNGNFSETDKFLTGSNTVSIKKAINYAVNNYSIEVTVDKSLINERVPVWTSENIPISQWVRQVFKRFDKIFYYDTQDRVQSIKIIGLKYAITEGQDKGLISESEKSNLFNQPQNYSAPPEDIIIHEFSETKTNLPSEMVIPDFAGQVPQTHEGIVFNSTLDESKEPPAGVKFSESPKQESADTDGVVITNKSEVSSESSAGLKFPEFQSKELAEAEGVELYQ